MPSLLTIRFDKKDGKTVSKFAISKTGLIWLRNDAAAPVTVTFGDQTPLCVGNTPCPSVVIASGEAKVFQVCDSVAEGQEFKYTAEVQGAVPEDPIVIIEPSHWVALEDTLDPLSSD